MSWNYRVGTMMIPTERVFGIIEVYYSEDGFPDGHSGLAHNTLSDIDNYKGLEEAYELIGKAFKEPIIDLDNFPDEYKEDK